jgi:anthranilate/para-aminobenzoate synthase component I
MSAWLNLGDIEVACASPERLVRLDADGVAETRPIKGTRPRGTTAGHDEELRADLETAAKDHAEHVMIVDVARNDLGRVCKPGSIEVAELATVEPHPTVWQMVSTVRGALAPGHDGVDLLRALFPAASMTGAPKVQAMRLISRLERSQRGVYSGAIGYIDDGGPMDMGVVIRTLVRVGDRVSFHSGGAITSDSDPVAEEQETLDKVAGLVAALQA